MSTTYGPPTRQLPKDLSALGNLTVRIEENAAGATDQDVNVVAVAGTAQTARNWSSDLANLPIISLDTAKLDVALTILAKLERWGKNVEPAWTHGAEATNPADGAALVTKAVSAAKTGFIYGFYITSPEARDFKINWTSGTAKSIRIVYASKGTTMFTDKTPVNEGLGADASTNMTITNVGVGAGIFQAGLLTVEV